MINPDSATNWTILGPSLAHGFTNFQKEEGRLYGKNDVILGKPFDVIRRDHLGACETTKIPKLHLHIPSNIWSTFTGKLREYLLPWRWKAIYLEMGEQMPTRVLVAGQLPRRLAEFVNRTWLATNLISVYSYDEIFGVEYLLIEGKEDRNIEFVHPWGEWMGSKIENTNDNHYAIYRKRSVISMIGYQLLKRYSPHCKEVTIRVGAAVEKIIIMKADEEALMKSTRFNISS